MKIFANTSEFTSYYKNLQIGALFDSTHVSVSRRVAIIRRRIAGEQKLMKQISAIKSQIKPHFQLFYYLGPDICGMPKKVTLAGNFPMESYSKKEIKH